MVVVGQWRQSLPKQCGQQFARRPANFDDRADFGQKLIHAGPRDAQPAGGAVHPLPGNAKTDAALDKLGDLPEAIESAAELAGLERGSYTLDYIEQQLGVVETLMLSMTAEVVAGVDRLVDLPRLPAGVTQALDSTLEPIAFIDRFNDPRGIYAYCFCDTQ